ncbi:heme oxygenase-like domain-containing protein [Sphingomonas radiodurans]|uniref:hypothetical protein n=1 Tax=Sphingomonas radiodurans TaxID=2890321 RepID=UPI001E32EA9E|nr:hypothetical protein [Sphingomonas radiodurans]WBH17040.1 hypothetical protein LLW23_02660 [Sphingomonas radiodurans]
MSLYEATRDLHHACEAHPIGQRMTAGAITPGEWAYWLSAFREIHQAIDPHFPAHLARVALLDADLSILPQTPVSASAEVLAASLNCDAARHGAAYVLHGAHRRGGRVLAKTMAGAGLPSAHVVYALPIETEAMIKSLRERDDIADHARCVFKALLGVMEEMQMLARARQVVFV